MVPTQSGRTRCALLEHRRRGPNTHRGTTEVPASEPPYRVILFVSVWLVITIAIVFGYGIAHVGTWSGFLAIIAFPVLLAATDGFTVTETRGHRRTATAMLALGLFWTTPASYFYWLPMPFTSLLFSLWLGSGKGFALHSADYWAHPLLTGFAILVILVVNAALAWLVATRIIRLALRLDTGWAHHLNWLAAFPISLGALLVFQGLLLVLRACIAMVGLDPPA